MSTKMSKCVLCRLKTTKKVTIVYFFCGSITESPKFKTKLVSACNPCNDKYANKLAHEIVKKLNLEIKKKKLRGKKLNDYLKW